MESCSDNSDNNVVIYASPEMQKFEQAFSCFEILLKRSPLSDFFVEASVLLYAMQVRYQMGEVNRLLPEKVNLDYYLNMKQRIEKMDYYMQQDRNEMDDIMYMLSEEQSSKVNLSQLLVGLGNDSDMLSESMECLRSGSSVICDYYEMCMSDVDLMLSEMSHREFSEEDFLRMVMEQYHYYWQKVWHQKGVEMKNDLDSMDSIDERNRQLKSERRQLNKRMSSHKFSGIHSDFLDDDGKQCRYEDMFKELYSLRNMRWTIVDLNEYFDIVIMRRFVEDMLNGKHGVLRYHPLFKVDKQKMEVVQNHPNWGIYQDLEVLLRNVSGCIRSPYTIDYVLGMVGEMLMGEVLSEGDSDAQREFEKFITNGGVKAKRLGRIGLNHFYRFMKLLIEKRVMQMNDTYGVVIRRAAGEGWVEGWNISTFEGCFSESWSSKMGVKFPTISEQVDKYLKTIGK